MLTVAFRDRRKMGQWGKRLETWPHSCLDWFSFVPPAYNVKRRGKGGGKKGGRAGKQFCTELIKPSQIYE